MSDTGILPLSLQFHIFFFALLLVIIYFHHSACRCENRDTPFLLLVIILRKCFTIQRLTFMRLLFYVRVHCTGSCDLTTTFYSMPVFFAPDQDTYSMVSKLSFVSLGNYNLITNNETGRLIDSIFNSVGLHRILI